MVQSRGYPVTEMVRGPGATTDSGGLVIEIDWTEEDIEWNAENWCYVDGLSCCCGHQSW
jgi:hypothetical protein